MNDISKILCNYVSDISFNDLDPKTIENVKKYIIDYLAAICAGKRINEKFNDAIYELMLEEGKTHKSFVAFSQEKMSVSNAAYMNAIYAHGADMDDGNKKSMGHIGAHVISAIFALADQLNVKWSNVFVSIVVGYDIFNRIAGAAQPGIVKRGFHSTGIAGSVASACACAKLLDLNEEQIYNALSLAALQSSGLLIITESGQSCKPLNPANAAKIGILSAKLAQKGIEGPKNPLESKKGWFNAFSETFDEEILLSDLGTEFTINESYLKPYSSCRHTHCGIECGINIRSQIIKAFNEFNVKNISKIELYIYQNAITVAGNVVVPKSDEETKFSLHYSLAISLAKGEFGFKYLNTEELTSEIRYLINKISIIPCEDCENVKLGIRGCKVNVKYNNFDFSYFVKVPKGDKDNPFNWNDLKNKFLDCSNDLMNEDKVNLILANIKNLKLNSSFKNPIYYLDN